MMNNASVKIKEDKAVAQRYLDPTNDIAFKKVFATEEHKPSLISFLNAILRLEEENWIKDVALLPQEESPLIDGGRRVVFDVKCTDKKNREFIVEMQNRKVPEFVKRSQYYVSHCYVSQIGKGTPYFKLKPVVLIAISNFELFTDDEDPISYHQTLNIKTQNNHLKDLEYVFVELPKFMKDAKDLSSVEDQWLYFLKHAGDIDTIPQSVVSQEIKESFRTLEQFNWNAEEYDAYICSNISLTDEYTALKQAKDEGKAEGKAEGIEEGEKRGKAEGIEEGEKRVRQIALALLQQGQDPAFVSKATGLSEANIEKMHQTLGA